MSVQSVLRAVEVASVVIAWLSVGLLVAAAVMYARRTFDDDPPPVSRRGRLCQAIVAVPVAVAVISAVALGVPLAYGWGSVAAVVLMLVLLRRDERFWAALAMLFPIFTLTGLVLMAALANNFVEVGGPALWYGGRQLEAWGGPHANPSYPHWEWTVVALAVTRYGLPLALIVTTAWVATVRGAMTKIERLGLVTAGQSLLAAVAIGATFSIIVLGAGLLQGLPVHFVVLGILGSLFTLLTVGPGAVGGILVEGRTLRSRVPTPAQGAYTLVSSISSMEAGGADPEGVGEDLPVWRSLLGFLTGELSGLKRLNLILLGLFGGLIGIVVVSNLLGDGFQRSRRVHFEYIDEERAVGFVVDDAYPVAQDAVWLVGDGQVALFDPTTGDLEHIPDLGVVGSTVDDGRLLVLTRARRPWLVAIDPRRPDRREEIVQLEREAGGLLAVTESDVYVVGSGNRLRRFDRGTGAFGTQVAMEYDDPVEHLFADDTGIITVQDAEVLDQRILRRDLETLAPTRDVDESLLATVDAVADETPHPELEALLLADDLGDARDHETFSRVLVSQDGQLRWWAHGLGIVRRLRARAPEERYDFHYDSINGVFETEADGAWLLVDDDQGTILDETAELESYLAHWDGPPEDGRPQ